MNSLRHVSESHHAPCLRSCVHLTICSREVQRPGAAFSIDPKRETPSPHGPFTRSRVRMPPITLRKKGCCPRSVSSFPAWSRHRSPRDRGPFSWPASPENVPNTIDNESAHEQHTNRSLPSLIHMEHKYEVDRLKHVNNTWHGPATCRQSHRFDSHDAKAH